MYNVILPTFNEENNIKIIIKMLFDVFDKLDKPFIIIVVDDNSIDNTQRNVNELIKKLHKKNKEILLITREKKLGLGSAYLKGLNYTKYDYTIILDSDLQHNVFDILKMARFKEYDLVIGTRYDKLKKGKVCKISLLRKLISLMANNLARLILDIKSTDVTGSFRIYKTDKIKKLIKSVKNTGFGFQMEVLALAEYKNYKIKEVPITFYTREDGMSKIRIKDILLFIISLIELYFRKF